MAESLYLLDGHAQIYRAYYAPFRDLMSPSGEPTRATYVFFSMLFNLIDKRRPTFLAMALDSADSSESRRAFFAEYKTNRSPPPEDLLPQIDRIVTILRALEVPVLEVPGFEADDVLATLSRKLSGSGLDIFLVSKDKDLEQLIEDRVRLYDPSGDVVIDAETLQSTKGYPPEKAVEVQTLTGDKTDNIPGIEGVGLKTAAKLIDKYGSAAEVVARAADLTPKMGEKVRAFAPQLPVTRDLVRLRRDLEVALDLEDARFKGFNVSVLRAAFRDLGFTRLLEQLDNLDPSLTCAADRAAPPPAVQVRASPPVHYELITASDELHAVARRLQGQSAFALDTETTGVNAVDADLIGLSLSWETGHACYIPIRAVGIDPLPQSEVVKALAPVFADDHIGKCGHNLKYDLVVLAQVGIAIRGALFDSMVASFLLDPLRRSHSLQWLAREFFDHHMMPIQELIGRGKQQATLDQIEITRVCEYAAEDADFAWRLYAKLGAQMQDSALASLFWGTEMPLVEVLARMELNGVSLDLQLLQDMSRKLNEGLEDLTKSIHTLAGHNFNIESTKQLARVLFDEQGLRVVRKTKTGRSTSAETLTILAAETDNPLPAQVLAYRELTKLKSTYVDNLPLMVCKKTNRVHASFNMIGAVTGRLSSSDPNLQNIPIRTELGRNIRKAFVPGRPQHVLLTADYSQIELRLLAHFSQDEALLRAFQRDEDIHRFVASEVFGARLEDVTEDQRSRAKAVNFGIIYGQTAFGLSRSTAMSIAEAQHFIDVYFERYPRIRTFIDESISRAEQEGYAATLLGRRRPLPGLRSRNRQQRQQAERLAVNTVLQGSAADLIKRAMIEIHRGLEGARGDPQMLIQVHDELVFEVQHEAAEQFADVVRRLMCSAIPLEVPLKVDVGWGENWYESKAS